MHLWQFRVRCQCRVCCRLLDEKKLNQFVITVYNQIELLFQISNPNVKPNRSNKIKLNTSSRSQLSKYQRNVWKKNNCVTSLLTYMKLFSCDWFPTSKTAINQTKSKSTLHFNRSQQIHQQKSERRRLPSEASTSIEGTLGGMRRRRNLQIAKANARTRTDHQNAIGGRKENWFVRVWKKVLESSISVGGKCYEWRREWWMHNILLM